MPASTVLILVVLRVILKAVQDSLPSGALHLDGVLAFSFKGLYHFGDISFGGKVSHHLSAVPDGIFHKLVLFKDVEDPAKVKAMRETAMQHLEAALAIADEIGDSTTSFIIERG